MRMQDKATGDSEKTSVEGISNRHEQQSQDEKKAVQARTFSRWMNVFLQKSDPPLAVHDLFTDIQDGRILMALLEELSGCKLLYRFRSSPHRIFRLNNISKALAFLDDRHVKLLGIDATCIADGNPSVVLTLIWNIILYFQVKRVTGALQRHLSSSLSSLSLSSYPSSSDLSPRPNDIGSYSCKTLPSKGRKAARDPKYHGKAIKTLLQWVQRCTSKFGVDVHDFGKSWRSGLAFLALIKSINPTLVDLRESLHREPRENIQLAFMIAHHHLDIPPLLEPEDVSCTSPDEQSIITYVSTFLGHCSDIDEGGTSHMGVPNIPNFGSLDSIHFGETLTDEPEAQALLKGLGKSHEQLLWKKWARRPSGRSSLSSSSGDIFSSCRSQSIPDQLVGCGSISPFSRKKSRPQSILKPPSPLDADVVSQEIRSWMEEATVDQVFNQRRVDESHFSLSSEEGIYSLSALDSDEEEAYSYILDLNKEVFPSHVQLKRQIPRVEEEKAEEMFLNGQQTDESRHGELRGALNGSGCKHQGGALAQNVESEVSAQSAAHDKSDWNENESGSRETVNTGARIDAEPEEESKPRQEREEESVVGGQRSNDDSNYFEEEMKKEKTEHAGVVTHGCARVGEGEKTQPFEVDSWKKESGEKTERGVFVSEKSVRGEEEEEEEEEGNLTFQTWVDRSLEIEDTLKAKGRESRGRFDEAGNEVQGDGAARIYLEVGNDRKVNSSCKDEHEEEYSEGVKIHKTTKEETTLKNKSYGGVNVQSGDSIGTSSCSATSQAFREAGFILQSLAASCDITPLELEAILVLWILLYCYFILPQMIL